MSNSKELIAARNKKIYERYRQLYDEQYLRHERCITLLSKEFFKSESGIYKAVLEEKKKDPTQSLQPA